MKSVQTGWLELDRSQRDLTNQLCNALRERILLGDVRSGTRLPSSRILAKACGVSRSTVVEAYSRLRAEGFLDALEGSSTRVKSLPEMPTTTLAKFSAVNVNEEVGRALPFLPGSPALDGFPNKIWGKYLARSSRNVTAEELDYGQNTNLIELRRQICQHLSERRGVITSVERIIIMPTTGAILDAIARLTVEANLSTCCAWIEEPGYPAAQSLLWDAGFDLQGVACDESGIAILKGKGKAPKLIYVTPSHQYPTGVTMSLSRRLELLKFAQANGALIVEDDYDSEFQFNSLPIAALQSIDRGQCVAYIGTFSKVLAPGLRVAYAVLPERLLQPILNAQRQRGLYVSTHIQSAMSGFIADGHLRAYIRSMNQIYAAKMILTRDALARHGSEIFELANGGGGLQLAVWFKDRTVDDGKSVESLRKAGYGVQALSTFYLLGSRPGLLFGIGKTPANIDESIRQLVKKLGNSYS